MNILGMHDISANISVIRKFGRYIKTNK